MRDCPAFGLGRQRRCRPRAGNMPCLRGSSPRSRGTLGYAHRSWRDPRLLPRVGTVATSSSVMCTVAARPRDGRSAPPSVAPCTATSAHPRDCGEQCALVDSTAFGVGYPRARGEHGRVLPPASLIPRLSPRARGTPKHVMECGCGDRFIPARAGNTARRVGSTAPSTVHPRAGGEHVTVTPNGGYATGSSPRGRGTRIAAEFGTHGHRFIPARAGNTR